MSKKRSIADAPSPDDFVKAGRVQNGLVVEEKLEPVKAPAKKQKKPTADPEETQRFTMDIPKSLHRKFKVTALMREESMADLIRKYIEGYVKRNVNEQWFE
jgi:hypothetical protein